MAIEITQEESEILLSLKKICVDNLYRDFPPPGYDIIIPLVSIDHKEDFLMDIEEVA